VREEPFDRAELIRYFRDESEELLQEIDLNLLRLEKAPGTAYGDPEIVNALFRALHTIKGSAGMLELHEVSTLAHRLETLCEGARADLTPAALPVDVLLEGCDRLRSLIRETSSSAPHAQPKGRGRTRTLRVDIARLDVLLDLVGELVITKNRIVQLAAALARGGGDEPASTIGDLNAAVGLLSRITSELQEGVMRARMVRLGGVFERFPRLLRDLAKSRGKPVDLIIEGADTDLDKTIADEISEPLTHLLRNCIEHGIESPKGRRLNRKPPVGSIRLRAATEGGSVVITISDDGGGIDLERVRERAVALGLIDSLAQPSESELMELLFAPGLSTAHEVTELSGRGVGLDVVRRAIARLSGRLEVASQRGLGTTFTIRLPLTLAIVTALLVRIAGAVYAVPLDAVSESLRIDAREIAGGPGGEVLAHRGHDLAVIRAAEFFELGTPGPGGGKLHVAILRAAGREIALVVDEFVGEQEIVVKPLSELVGPIAGIAGGTILGDGTIALILDPIALATHVDREPGSIVVSTPRRQP
jgi:two-component system chemotaxis sensor kinase CheA